MTGFWSVEVRDAAKSYNAQECHSDNKGLSGPNCQQCLHG